MSAARETIDLDLRNPREEPAPATAPLVPREWVAEIRMRGREPFTVTSTKLSGPDETI